jgi:hypothetical protein
VAWTYDLTTLDTSPKDQVRFLVGDTDINEHLLQDEEINWLLANTEGLLYTAVRAAESIASFFGRQVWTRVGQLQVRAEVKYKNYLDIADTLRRRASLGDAAPVMLSVSLSGKAAGEGDGDRVKPMFARHQNDNPNIGSMDGLGAGSVWP